MNSFELSCGLVDVRHHLKRCAVVCLFALASGPLYAGYWTGDATGDGRVEVDDLAMVVKALLTGHGVTAAMDATDDGHVDMADISAIADIVLGRAESVYVESVGVSNEFADRDGDTFVKEVVRP